MNTEIYGDLRCVIRAYNLAISAKTDLAKKARLQNLKNISSMFVTKWNAITGKDLSMSEWIYKIGGIKNNEQIYQRISR